MKKIYFLLIAFLVCATTFSQVNVTATVGGAASFTDLKTAFDAINAGAFQETISITINGTTTETASAVLNASGSGSAAYIGISIKPTGGIPCLISGNIAGPLIDFNGADNVTIDGLNSGGNSLTILNSNNAAASTIRFINDATANTIQNANILGAGTSVTSGAVFFSTGTATGNDNNTIANCNIADAAGSFSVNAIYSAGTATAGQENSGNTIFNNNISNFFNAGLLTVGILISTGNTDWTISGNKLFQTDPRTFTVGNIHRGIQVSAGNNYSIINNTIGYASSSATGTYTLGGSATRFIAIDLAVGNVVASSLQNNVITNFSLSTSSGANSANGIWCAINITSGDVNVGTINGNTIGNTTGVDAIVATPSTGGSFLTPVNLSSTGNINFANNTFGGISLVPTLALSGTINCIISSGTSGNIVINKNTIGNAAANNIRVGTPGATTANGNLRGIFITNNGTISITSNIIRNLTHNSNNALALYRAIEIQAGAATITGNTISNISANGAATTTLTPEGVGIAITTAPLPNTIIDGNTISNLSVTNSAPASGPALYGIYLSSAVANASVTRNKIFNFSNAGTSANATVPSIIAGIYCRDAAAANPNILIANNMFSFGNSQSTNTAIIGIWNIAQSATGATMKIYYNSVNIEGTVTSGAQPSFCYYRGDFTTTQFTSPTIDIKNNIFTNSRTGGTGKHYAIANNYGAVTSSSSGWGANAADYNVLNANAATIGYWSGDQSFSGWQSASAGDVHSLSGVPVSYVNSASDLHLVTTSNSSVDGKAIPIAIVTTDIDGGIRDASTPDIGADEFTPTPLAISVEYFNGNKQGNINVLNWKAGCSSASVKFEIERSSNGRNFNPVSSLFATQARCAQPFDFTDNNPAAGINYYRLKMTEIDGKIYYSIIIAIINKEKGFEIVGLLPTFIDKGNAILNVTAAQKTILQIVINNMQGKIMQRENVTLNAGSNTIALDLSNLSKGVYQITGYSSNGEVRTVRFVKQ